MLRRNTVVHLGEAPVIVTSLALVVSTVNALLVKAVLEVSVPALEDKSQRMNLIPAVTVVRLGEGPVIVTRLALVVSTVNALLVKAVLEILVPALLSSLAPIVLAHTRPTLATGFRQQLITLRNFQISRSL
jgi:hypothetical protein